MSVKNIECTIQKYIENKDIPCGILQVRKDGETVYLNKWGYSDISAKKGIEFSDVFRMMSMTKPVTAVAVMKLVERGKIELDDAVSKYISSFADMRVVDDKRFVFKEKMNPVTTIGKLLLFNHIKPKTVRAERQISIRDLLSHTSGLEQGVWGYMSMLRSKDIRTSPEAVAEKYSRYCLDWQPGSQTSYSALAGFDVLVRIIEVVSGMSAAEFFEEEIFGPLDMKDSSFSPDHYNGRLVRLYKHTKNGLKDVTGAKADVNGAVKCSDGYVCGSGGLYSTLADYGNFIRMLADNGRFKGAQFMKSETVELIRTEAPAIHLEPEPGMVWGLGVRIRQDGVKGSFNATPGTYGWSGAFGTHFFISPEDKLDAIWLTNLSNAGGSGSPVSRKIETLIFDTFKEE